MVKKMEYRLISLNAFMTLHKIEMKREKKQKALTLASADATVMHSAVGESKLSIRNGRPEEMISDTAFGHPIAGSSTASTHFTNNESDSS